MNEQVTSDLNPTESPGAYLPADRRRAIAVGAELPDQTSGAALFADISGFTPLTQALVAELGLRRGADELTRQLNTVYGGRIAEVHRYGGSVLTFSGDATTCWFDADDGLRATASSNRSSPSQSAAATAAESNGSDS